MITLKIYSKEDKNKVEKTHQAEGYDLMLGTVEDFMNIIDIDKLQDRNEVTKMVMKGYQQLKPLIKDIFPDLTDEEYRRIKISDLIVTIIQVGTAVIENLKIIRPEKN